MTLIWLTKVCLFAVRKTWNLSFFLSRNKKNKNEGLKLSCHTSSWPFKIDSSNFDKFIVDDMILKFQ
jgi:hypothetical protein